MKNSSTPKYAMDDHQTPEEEEDQPVYRFVNMADNTEVPSESVFLESPDVNLGDIIEVELVDGKKDYLTVDHITESLEEVAGLERQISTVYLIRVRSSLWKTMLLLAILAAGWYVIEFILQYLT